MKKVILGVLAGLILGGAGVWVFLHRATAETSAAEKPAATAEEKSEPGVHLKKEQIEAAGLKMASPEMTDISSEVTAYGRVLDAVPLLVSFADVSLAQAALAATDKEYKRTKALFDDGENASAQTVETTEAAMQRDRVLLRSAEARLAATWGRALVAKRESIAAALGEGATLVRVDVPPGEAIAPDVPTVRIGLLSENSKLATAEMIGAAPTADPQLQGTGYLALLREQTWPAGAALRGVFAGPAAAEKFPVLPESALVRHEGSVFVYVQTGEGRFERRRIELGAVRLGKVAIKAGVGEGDRVVVIGAQQLLSTELGGGGEG